MTRIINELETYLGTQLFHRTTRTVTLTETGEVYLADAQRILEDLQTADDTARGAAATPTGKLRITASVLFGQYYIAPIIRDFTDLYEDVQVHSLFVDRIVNMIDEGIDIAVRIGPLADSSLKATCVGAVRQVICASPSYLSQYGTPQHPNGLSEHKNIDYDGLSRPGEWSFDNNLRINIKSRLRFSTLSACIESAKSGWGLARVLSYQIGPELVSGELQTVLSEHLREEWPIHLVHAEGRQRSAKVKLFIEMAKERLKENQSLNRCI